jgi:TRAP-type mannitol/chloroaromatic compound transport system permease small subunit
MAPIIFASLVFFLLLTLQGLSEIIKRAAALCGHARIDAGYKRPLQ